MRPCPPWRGPSNVKGEARRRRAAAADASVSCQAINVPVFYIMAFGVWKTMAAVERYLSALILPSDAESYKLLQIRCRTNTSSPPQIFACTDQVCRLRCTEAPTEGLPPPPWGSFTQKETYLGGLRFGIAFFRPTSFKLRGEVLKQCSGERERTCLDKGCML